MILRTGIEAVVREQGTDAERQRGGLRQRVVVCVRRRLGAERRFHERRCLRLSRQLGA